MKLLSLLLLLPSLAAASQDVQRGVGSHDGLVAKAVAAVGGPSSDGTCGGTNQFICTGTSYGSCCSSSSKCGSSNAHCGNGCQTAFGTCTTPETITQDGKCGANGKICLGSTFGDCCSSLGFCGRSSAHCAGGCNPAFGTCDAGSNNISEDSKCGPINGKTCKGSKFGNCCSAQGYCADTGSHCGVGCQSAFGDCDATPAQTSTDGSCGKNEKTCVGSPVGGCCSSSGFCGTSATYCGQGCQKDFSDSCLTKDIPSLDATCGANKGGFTCAGGPFNNQCCSRDGFCGNSLIHCGSGCQVGFGRCTSQTGFGRRALQTASP